MRRVPLVDKLGCTVAHAVVDDEDFAIVSEFSWHLSDGYARTNRDGLTVRMHRLIMGLTRGDPREVDHGDRDRLNNTKGNLTVVTRFGNAQNRPVYGGRAVCRCGSCARCKRNAAQRRYTARQRGLVK